MEKSSNFTEDIESKKIVLLSREVYDKLNELLTPNFKNLGELIESMTNEKIEIRNNSKDPNKEPKKSEISDPVYDYILEVMKQQNLGFSEILEHLINLQLNTNKFIVSLAEDKDSLLKLEKRTPTPEPGLTTFTILNVESGLDKSFIPHEVKEDILVLIKLLSQKVILELFYIDNNLVKVGNRNNGSIEIKVYTHDFARDCMEDYTRFIPYSKLKGLVFLTIIGMDTTVLNSEAFQVMSDVSGLELNIKIV